MIRPARELDAKLLALNWMAIYWGWYSIAGFLTVVLLWRRLGDLDRWIARRRQRRAA